MNQKLWMRWRIRFAIESFGFLIVCLVATCGSAQDSELLEQVDAPKRESKTVRMKESDLLEELVLVEAGRLPVLISAPHGGTMKIRGVEPRLGEGLPKGASGFFAGRDGGTEELAKGVVAALERKTGKRPYSVISAAHRKFLDPNRPAEIAYEDEDAKPVYERYHNSCRSFCREILATYRAGILIDVHGQGSSAETVYRGTNQGKTVTRLRERFGDVSHVGDDSLFGLLKKRGWTVYPDPFDGREQAGFTGGYIVQTHGSHRPEGIDAVQLELGADYRKAANRARIAEDLATAIIQYLDLYVPEWKLKSTAEQDEAIK
jgi:N-formylglutamate amidohydrolase